ncbi:MAG TPA: iron-containing redox enzyme family protein [Phenylobacterium sp.]|nr:iron-containing redox enzyme family protein [Phenylobacterium sp.]
MIGAREIVEIGARLADRAGPSPPAVYDIRIDAADMETLEDEALLRHAGHQTLLRAYQGRYVLLPSEAPGDSIVERLKRHYDPMEMGRLDALRPALEAELIGPLMAQAQARAAGADCGAYVAALLPELRGSEANPFLAFLEENPARSDHYRNFLIQSSADLLAEASASALGVVGEFGEPQSALFRILIDEFGYGAHSRKHSVLYRATLRDFGLSQEYNAYWPLFDTVTLELHNAIHHLFQNPRNFFAQIGFLLFAETSYQRSTAQHFRYLRRFHPSVDARYFGEHAHIDLHHAAMVVDEVVTPLVAKFGPEVGTEIVKGAELTRAVFDAAGEHMLAVSRAFDAAAAKGLASYGIPEAGGPPGRCVSPRTASGPGQVQVGGLGVLLEAGAFADFPVGAIGRQG